MNNYKPSLGITMGDPAGVGPEIIVKALSKKEIYEECRPVVIGDAKVIEKAIEVLNSSLKINPVSNIQQCKFTYGIIDVFHLDLVQLDKLKFGEVSSLAGQAAFKSIEKTIELALNKEIDGTITTPINKEGINKAGYKYSGHTEIYAEYTNTKDYAMLLVHDNLRVVHVTTHVSLRQALDMIKKDRVVKTIKLAHDACEQLGIDKPKVAVAGVNPHSGENGLFGDEEIKEIIPAIEEAKSQGIIAHGPIPADTVFSKGRGGIYDIVVAMYHDQGHIPLKVVGFTWDEIKKQWESVSGVNITLGLPIIRSSVDHGTAFDIAWKGIAREDSLVMAMKYGIELAKFSK